jgi:phytoene desaturase
LDARCIRKIFSQFGKVSDYYQLKRLDPSYRVYWQNEFIDIPANYNALRDLFEQIEPGQQKARPFPGKAKYKYQVGMQKLVFKPGQSLLEFCDWDLIKGLFRLDVFNSIKAHVQKYFKDQRLRQLVISSALSGCHARENSCTI